MTTDLTAQTVNPNTQETNTTNNIQQPVGNQQPTKVQKPTTVTANDKEAIQQAESTAKATKKMDQERMEKFEAVSAAAGVAPVEKVKIEDPLSRTLSEIERGIGNPKDDVAKLE